MDEVTCFALTRDRRIRSWKQSFDLATVFANSGVDFINQQIKFAVPVLK
jgi:hypothetical protein